MNAPNKENLFNFVKRITNITPINGAKPNVGSNASNVPIENPNAIE
jgi:hypothetical protein